MTIDSMLDMLGAGDTAIVIFTRNRHLFLRPDGTGYTGNWVIDPQRKYARVVIYNRDDGANAGGDVIVATHVDTRGTEEPGRYAVYFRDVVLRGKTEKDWKEFADTGQNPIRYAARA